MNDSLKTFREAQTFAKDFFWYNPDNAAIEQDFHVLHKNRDSDILTESNFAVALAQLAPLGAYSFQTSHWAHGWFEWLALPHDATPEAIQAAELLLERIDTYPVLDEQDYANRQTEAVEGMWKHASRWERIQWCADAGASIFAARDEYPPDEVEDMLEVDL